MAFARLVGESVDLPLKIPAKGRKSLEEAAMRWTYILRSRKRWVSTSDASERQAKTAAQQLIEFGLALRQIQALAKHTKLEVHVSAEASDDETWPARIMPWEYLVTAATGPYRQQALTVSRVLKKKHVGGSATPPTRPKILYVQSAPGAIAQAYDFSSERALVETYIQAKARGEFKEIRTPTLKELRATVKDFRPHIIHLAGVDTHQGAQIIADAGERSANATADWKMDGYLLASPQGSGHCVPATAQDLAAALTADGACAPKLVVFNIENSGTRLASRAVEAGVGTAVGFQDAFDEAAAELFFGTFYAELRETKWNLIDCFGVAWETVRARYPTLIGTGLVMWSDRPLLAPRQKNVSLEKPRLSRTLRTLQPSRVSPEKAAECIRVAVEPVEAINYSVLHNGGELFKAFRIMPEPWVRAFGIEVRAVLHAGAEAAAFERMVHLEGRPVDLRSDVRVALSAVLTRSIHESIVTTLLVDVRWGQHILEKKTFPVRLLPIDQWRDAKSARYWLPSFIFPRDAAVGQIIDQASKYVKVLRDDPTAGFEGYQCISPRHAHETRHVDLQVQAIWSAIVHEWKLTYVNPPPSYSKEMDSQRLRTPSMIHRDRCGTCIDLALLFAACCELVDIYPVVILLEGHAFPGYWRSNRYHADFKDARLEGDRIDEIASVDKDRTSIGGAQRVSWRIGPTAFPEIAREVREGRLVPLETVRLTENCGFAEAIEAGKESLADRDEFDSLIDIYLAREANITPLPLWGDSQ